MDIQINYTDYPDVIETIVINTGTNQKITISFPAADTIELLSEDTSTLETVTHTITKEELADMIAVLIEASGQIE